MEIRYEKNWAPRRGSAVGKTEASLVRQQEINSKRSFMTWAHVPYSPFIKPCKFVNQATPRRAIVNSLTQLYYRRLWLYSSIKSQFSKNLNCNNLFSKAHESFASKRYILLWIMSKIYKITHNTSFQSIYYSCRYFNQDISKLYLDFWCA